MARNQQSKKVVRSGAKNNGKRHGCQAYGLLYNGKPIARLFRILSIPDICA